jgi:hypothetical protein
MNKLTFILLYLFFCSTLNAQPYETNPDFKRANIWHFGYNAGLDFNNNPPSSLANGNVNSWEGCASICDTSGSLLFYTDGITVWDKFHDTMEGGIDLLGHKSSTHSAIIVNHPDNDTLYYIFTTSAHNVRKGLNFSVVNINSNNGKGKIILKNKLLNVSSTEKIAIINHHNNHDIWIIGHEYGTNTYYSYLLTKQGVETCPIISNEGTAIVLSGDGAGNLKFSSNGEILSNAFYISKKVELFSFNKYTGQLTFIESINTNELPYGLEFDKINLRLFITESGFDSNYISSYNIEKKELNTIAKHNAIDIQSLQVTVHNKIYIAFNDSSFLNCINLTSDSFSYLKQDLNLTFGRSSYGLPSFNQSYFHTPSIDFAYHLNCVDNTIQLNGRDTFGANTHNWLITKQGASPITENSKNSNLQFPDTGTYEIRYIASNSSRSDTITKQITVYPKIEKHFLGEDIHWCENIDTSVTVQAPLGMHCYEWSTGETNSEINTDSAGEYWVKITTPNFCVLYDTVVVSIDTLPNIEKNFLGEDIFWCENIDTVFTLTAPTGMMSYNWSTTDTTNEIIVNTPGIYWATLTAFNNCQMSDTILLKQDTLPNIEKNFLGEDISWCENIDTLINLNAPYGMKHYQWNTGDTLQFIETDSTGIYWVKATALNNCIISDTIELINYPAPEIPIIYKVSDTLKTESNADSYQWYLNEQTTGSNNPFLVITDTGIYKLEVTNSFGCSSYSDTFQYYTDTHTNITEHDANQLNRILIYPNPFENQLNITNHYKEDFDIKVYNINGQLVHKEKLQHGNNLIQTDKWVAGVYLIRIISKNQQIKSYKLIKQNE